MVIVNDKRNALTVAFAKCVQGYEVFDVEDYPEGFEMLKNNLLQLTFAGSVPIWPRFIKTYKSILDHFISYEEFNGTKFQQVLDKRWAIVIVHRLRILFKMKPYMFCSNGAKV